MIITSMGLPREIRERLFCRHVLLDCADQPTRSCPSGCHAVHDEVLTEFLAFCASNQTLRRAAGLAVSRLVNAPDIRILPQSRNSFLDGLALYNARPDKGYSLTDCISMQTMRREGLTAVLTNDRHFEQEGFRALFRF